MTRRSAQEFTFHRGTLALDFVGTLGQRASGRAVERVPDADALQRWLAEAHLLDPACPPPASGEYAAAMSLREAIARVCNALIDGSAPPEADLTLVNTVAADVRVGAPYLERTSLAERWRTDAPLRLALGRLAADAIRLIAEDRQRLTRCELATCGAVLLSGDRGERRRWCSMQSCGNRAKVAAFRARAATSDAGREATPRGASPRRKNPPAG